MTPEQIIHLKQLAQARLQTIKAPAHSNSKSIAAPKAAPLLLNEKQQELVTLVASGRSCCLIGAAGTGKTTTTNAAIQALRRSRAVPTFRARAGKHLIEGLPGIVGVTFTRRAAGNLRKCFAGDLQQQVMTIHSLLEFEPVFYSSIDDFGNSRKTMRFEPQRNAANPFPPELHTLVIDEASMVSSELWKLLVNAMSHPIQVVLIGDIQQLAPVFGEAILGFKLLELPVVELTHVYRQALESPIIRLAHRVLSGKGIQVPELSSDWQHPGQLTIARWPLGTSQARAENLAIDFLEKQLAAGAYDPATDMVLIPFNKQFGTHRLGRRIAAMLDSHQKKLIGVAPTIVEISAGFQKHYLAVGDRLLLNNEEYLLKQIKPNLKYFGKKSPSAAFDRFGHQVVTKTNNQETLDTSEDWLGELVDNTNPGLPSDEASHVLTLVPVADDADEELLISTRGQLNKLAFAYCTTVHKAQGLQAYRVYLLVHKDHNLLVCRELLYTAITRAQKELIVLCDNGTFLSGIAKQQITGTTLAEKAEYFKGKKGEFDKKMAT